MPGCWGAQSSTAQPIPAACLPCSHSQRLPRSSEAAPSVAVTPGTVFLGQVTAAFLPHLAHFQYGTRVLDMSWTYCPTLCEEHRSPCSCLGSWLCSRNVHPLLCPVLLLCCHQEGPITGPWGW